MKKNTAFIKRLRTSITSPNVSVFIQEVRTLSLHKYLSEIISACYEGLCRLKSPSDIAAGVEIVTALHQRFGPAEFTGYLGWFIGRGLVSPDKSQLKTLAPEVRDREEKDRLIRQRSLLRVATELWLTGVLRSLSDVVRPEFETKSKESAKSGDVPNKSKPGIATTKSVNAEEEPFPLEVLKDLLGHDREHVNLPIVVLFVKTFSWDVLGVHVQSEKSIIDDALSKEDTVPIESSEGPSITAPEVQQRFKNILTRYFDDVKIHLVRDQKSLSAQEKRNAEAYVRSGEVFEDRQASFEKQSKAQEKLLANAQTLAEILSLEMPDLKDKDDSIANGDGGIGLIKVGDYLKTQGDGPGIWEDEDERRFYENLANLKDKVPGMLLEEPKKKSKDLEDQVGKKPATKIADEEIPNLTEPDEQSISIANKSVGAQVDGLLARLPDLHSKESVDEFTIDFCFLNSKASRNRLIKSLQDLPKGRTDLLPYYARIVATLSRFMPDIAQAVVSHLDEEFRSLQRRKSKEFLGAVRLMNIRYMAELTKFGIVPEHVLFHCLKVCMDDFSRTNIEIMGSLMENCGRYLLRTPDTSPRMVSFLETLQRKKSAQHLDQRERLILENAMYYVNPPDRPAIQQKERTPMELFVQKILCEDMNKKTVEKSIKQLRKLHWDEPEVKTLILKYLSRPWKVQFNNIALLACAVSVLTRYHSYLGQRVIDELTESIMIGLQVNDVKYNQRRIAQLKYLGELYVYKLVDTSTVLDCMYKIVGYGYGKQRILFANLSNRLQNLECQWNTPQITMIHPTNFSEYDSFAFFWKLAVLTFLKRS
jgi:regulator of nonsense transcripts 2